MKKKYTIVKELKLTTYYWNLLIASMNQERIRLKNAGEDASVLSDLLLKVIDAPCR